jgi:hypothetical protein
MIPKFRRYLPNAVKIFLNKEDQKAAVVDKKDMVVP